MSSYTYGVDGWGYYGSSTYSTGMDVSMQGTKSQQTTQSQQSTSSSASKNSADSSAVSDTARNLAANRATLSDIRAWFTAQQTEEAKLTRKELEDFGMTPNAKFSLIADGKGGYTVNADSRDKPFITAFFKEHPEKADAFLTKTSFTARDVATYQEGIQKTLDEKIRKELDSKGFTEDDTYKIRYDGKGSYIVEADDPAVKEAVEAYLGANPDVAKLVTKIGTAFDVDLTTQAKPETTPEKPSASDTKEAQTERDAINKLASSLLLQSLRPGTTSSQLEKSRAELQSRFEAQVKADLKALGVDENVKFRLVTDRSGKVQVVTDSADKKVIEKYFEDNPSMSSAFLKIDKLGTSSAISATETYDPRVIRQRIQLESMNAWFMNMNSSSSSSGFFGADISLANSLNKTV